MGATAKADRGRGARRGRRRAARGDGGRATARCRGGDGGRSWLPGRRGTRRSGVKAAAVAVRVSKAQAKRPARSRKRPSGGGARAQRGHGRDQCLAHQCPGEEDLETRCARPPFDGDVAVRREHRLRPERRAMVANWMATRFHRVNILERRFHEIGVGAVERVKDRCKRATRRSSSCSAAHGGTPRH